MHDMTRALPSGSWTHSFEEDEDGVEVYRPTATFAFPASRKGRRVLDFNLESSTLTAMLPGPDDRPRAGPATRLIALGMNRYALGGTPEAPQDVIEIVEAEAGILMLARH